MKILGTGLHGLVGSRIVQLLEDSISFKNISRSSGVDITNTEKVLQSISDSSDSDLVLHLAAKADVDKCENDKLEDQNLLTRGGSFEGKDSAWAVNVLGTQNVVDACEKLGKKIIYISTDFVFDGTKESYTEEDKPNPINWYGQTKYEGELRIKNASCPWLIVRIAFPYRSVFPKLDFARAILENLKQKKQVKLISDQVITPTFIDDIAMVLENLIQSNATGIYNVVGSASYTPLEIGKIITKEFHLDANLIASTTREEYFKGRASRPFRLALKNDKILQLGLTMKPFEEGLLFLKQAQ